MDIRFIGTNKTAELMDCSKTSLFRQLKAGLLPKPVKMGQRCMLIAHEIQIVLKERVKGASEDELRQLVSEIEERRVNLE